MMGFLDLISGLSFVAGHIGLARLDRGLRDSITIPAEQLQAQVTLLARNAQVVTLTNQIKQLRSQADQYKKQKLNAQHAQLMVQVGQLQLQLQQLDTERQHLQLEVKRELRLAQENRILRLFVDVYEQAQTYRLQGQLLDHVVLSIAALRIYRQVYNDLDDAHNRLKLSELRERLFNDLRAILADPGNREKMAQAYTAILQQPLTVLDQAQLAFGRSQQLLGAADQAEALAGNWGEAVNLAAAGTANLQSARKELAAARQNMAGLMTGVEWREAFFPRQPEITSGILTGVAADWQAWLGVINDRIGRPLDEVYRGLEELPGRLEQTEKKLEAAAGQSRDRQLTYQLAESLTRLGEILPAYQARYTRLSESYQPHKSVPAGASPAAWFDGLVAIRQVQGDLIRDLGPFVTYLDANRHASDRRYQAEAGRRMTGLGQPSGGVSEAFGLYESVRQLNAAITRSIQAYHSRLRKPIATETGINEVRSRSLELAGEAVVAEADELAGKAPAQWWRKARQALRTQSQKTAYQRRNWLGYFESLYRPAGSEAVSDLPPLDRLPPLPALGKGGNVRPLVRLTPANTIAAPQKSRTPVMVMVGLALGVMCLCAFALTLPPRTLTAPNATGSAAAPLAAVTGTETPALASTAEATAVVVVPPTDTPPPAATKTVVPTSTIDPSFTPPTPTPSSTIAPTATPTEAPVGKMPGLVPDKLVAELRVLGYTCGAPDLAMGVYSWWCDRKTETKTFIVEIWSRTLDTIDAVRGTVIHLDLVADDTLALTLLKYLAALPYTNAQPEKATAWVEQTLPTIKQNGDVRTAQYGGVAYELYGLPTGRSLVVGTFVEP